MEQDKYIEIIQKSGERMLSTVNDSIEVSKIETEQVSLSLREVHVHEQLGFLFQFFKPEVENKGMQLFYENELNIETIIQTDESKFNSILTNLIKNSIKYSDEGSIKIICKRKNIIYFLR